MANKRFDTIKFFFFVFFESREKKFPIEIPDYTRTRNRPITRPLSPVELSMTRQRRLRIQKHRFYARQHRILICIWMAYLSRYFQPIGINVKRAEVTIYIYIYTHHFAGKICHVFYYSRYLYTVVTPYLRLFLVIGIVVSSSWKRTYWFYYRYYWSNDCKEAGLV